MNKNKLFFADYYGEDFWFEEPTWWERNKYDINCVEILAEQRDEIIKIT